MVKINGKTYELTQEEYDLLTLVKRFDVVRISKTDYLNDRTVGFTFSEELVVHKDMFKCLQAGSTYQIADILSNYTIKENK